MSRLFDRRLARSATRVICVLTSLFTHAQQRITIIPRPGQHAVDVRIDNKPFTTFLYPDSLEKPVLYPVYAPDGKLVTRGFPLAPRPGEPTDHPHHIGIWFNYENVNGLDFWNNSFAIPADKKSKYGWIRNTRIVATKGNELTYESDWTDQKGNVLLHETTTFAFGGDPEKRTVVRKTKLKANQDVSFTDAKDGLLGMRVARELQIPTAKPQVYNDANGIKSPVAAGDGTETGNYLTSEGKTGDSAWSTRGRWCKLYGKMGADSVSISMIDHPSNENYPTYWHARGYGLFAANPLGAKIFSNGAKNLNFVIGKGMSATFRYEIVVQSGKTTISAQKLNSLADGFAAGY